MVVEHGQEMNLSFISASPAQGLPVGRDRRPHALRCLGARPVSLSGEPAVHRRVERVTVHLLQHSVGTVNLGEIAWT
ncbi:hypothetical protein [Streptomyces noursei]|uniref:hypothetical protein n=1 Tax=Streptomyces noursei TaxID=1971 RepID=UPI0016753E17|nr:hypothetical protein [Streptomyces noursei]MCZ1021245.1 hypothetical protein [Streptomyces noursei]